MQLERAQHQTHGLEKAIFNAHHALTQAGPAFWVTFFGIALILTIALGTSLMISGVRDRELNRTEKELEGTVQLLAKQFDKNIETFEATPRSVANYLASKSSSPEDFKSLASSGDFHHALQEKVTETADFAGINVFDAKGNFINSSERWPVPPVNLSDRAFFQKFKLDSNSPAVLIELVDSRLAKGSTIVVARKVSSPDGTFLGMVTRSISPDALGPDSALVLLHRDGSLLARYPHSGELEAESLFESSLISQASASGYATMPLDSPIDGQSRLASAKGLEHYPIYVVATREDSAVLAGWRRETKTLVTAAVLISIIVGIMLIAIARYLREQHRRLDIAVNNMAQGLLLYDASERLVLVNQQFLDMFRLSSEIVKPGCRLRDIIQHRKQTGSFIGDVDEYCERMRQASKSGRITLAEIPDGRWMQVLNKAVKGGGWVTTIEDVTEQRRTEERTIRLASYDALTELPNRELLRTHLSRELEGCSPENQVAVLFLDMDEFKAVNDTLGHQVGDELLKSVARGLQSCVGPNEFVARLGGDEFALVISRIKSQSQFVGIIEKIYEVIRRPHECASHQLVADTSIGIAFAPTHGRTYDELLQNADLAMYEAKSSGKRTHRIFEPQLEKRAKDRRQLETDLRRALATGSLDVHYQPIVDLQTNEINGCEALARWKHAERGYVSPADFIPVAEQAGLIVELGEYVLRTACTEAARWPKTVKLAVNVSPLQFKSDTFAFKVVAALAESGLSPQRLELEITEAVLIGDDDAALKILHELKSIGVRVALDDFGTGYSSLSYLRRFPFDKIKIDRSFVSGLTEVDSSSAIVRAVVAMAAEHKMVTTAEGVETVEQREILRDLNCAEMQGFLFSRARSGTEVMQMMAGQQGERLAAS